MACLGAGRHDEGFEWLGRAVDARDPLVVQSSSLPLCDGFRSDPRFASLLARMNLS